MQSPSALPLHCLCTASALHCLSYCFYYIILSQSRESIEKEKHPDPLSCQGGPPLGEKFAVLCTGRKPHKTQWFKQCRECRADLHCTTLITYLDRSS
jgi:hypothetical protein